MAAALHRSLAGLIPDSELFGRFVMSRDEAAFAELVRRHGPIVHRICRRIIGPSFADDAFQATFLVLATRASQVRKAASVGSWLIGVAGRVARQMRRNEGRVALVNLDRKGQGDSVDTADLAAALDDELTRLPDQLRAPLVACLVQHRTHKQAAVELGSSERTLRRRLDQAKRVLQMRLERRGIVPVVAAGLVSGLGVASASVSRELADRAVNLVFDFLAGGAAVASAPAVIAKGVTMNGILWKVKVAMVAVAVGLAALGIGLAGDPPKTEHIPPVDRRTPDRQPPQPLSPFVGTIYEFVPPKFETRNFIVTSPDDIVARAVANEAEHQRKALAERWFGKELPVWEKQGRIEVVIDFKQTSGVSTFTYGREVGFGKDGVDSIAMKLTGSFEQILRTQLLHEVTHTVLATHFGKPLPRWADEGIALLNEPAAAQLEHDIKCRELLNAGRGIPLKHLLSMMEYPKDLPLLYAQGHTLTRFLIQRGAKLGRKPEGEKANPFRHLIDFIDAGLRKNTPEGWNAAVKEHYDFADSDALQEAWIEWLRKPESSLKPVEAKPAVEKKDDPLTIPPTRLGK